MASRALTSLFGLLVGRSGQPSAITSTLGVTIAAGAPNAKYIDTTLLGATAAHEVQAVPLTSALGVTVAYTIGAPEVFTSRAWSYVMDGHPMYVLHLGQQGTFVYDLSTQQWSQFKTAGFDTWNAEYGTKWNDYIVAGSLTDGSLWYLNEDAFLDEEFREITRVVTGGIPQRARKAVTNYNVSLAAAVGEVEEDSDSSVTLEISDDNGANWIDVGSIELTPGDYTQELSWLSLGMVTAPGRIYRFTDIGGLRRIDDAEAKLEGEDDKDNPDNS